MVQHKLIDNMSHISGAPKKVVFEEIKVQTPYTDSKHKKHSNPSKNTFNSPQQSINLTSDQENDSSLPSFGRKLTLLSIIQISFIQIIVLFICFYDFNQYSGLYWEHSLEDHPPIFSLKHNNNQDDSFFNQNNDYYHISKYLSHKMISDSYYYRYFMDLPTHNKFSSLRNEFKVKIFEPKMNIVTTKSILHFEFHGDAMSIPIENSLDINRYITISILDNGNELKIPNSQNMSIQIASKVSLLIC